MEPVVDQPPPRRRLWRFRRYASPLPPDPLNDTEDPVLDGPAPEEYYPEAEDFVPSPPRPLGPLSRVPRLASVRPALLCLGLFFAASGYHWNAVGGGGF